MICEVQSLCGPSPFGSGIGAKHHAKIRQLLVDMIERVVENLTQLMDGCSHGQERKI